MTLDDNIRWRERNRDTKVTWTEEEVYKEWVPLSTGVNTHITTEGCKLVMAGILGSIAAAMGKYPEMFI